MAKPNIDSVIGDCPDCNAPGAVLYRGPSDDNPSTDEAVCSSCGNIFEVGHDDEPASDAPVPAPVVPAPLPTPIVPTQVPVVPVAQPEVGNLTPVVAAPDGQQPRLDPQEVTDFGNGDDGISSHIKNARPWKFAHKLGKVGNPYREKTNNYIIFSVYEKLPSTIEECVLACAEVGLNKKLSYLLTVYEVTSHCLMAGLLVMDPETKKITLCQGKPVPTKLT